MQFRLRNFQITDAESLASAANDAMVSQYLREVFPFPYTLQDAEWYLDYCLQADPKREWIQAIDIAGRAVGSISASFPDDLRRQSAELGYWLAQPYWGKGIMTRAITEFCRAVFAASGVVRIYAEVFAENKGSQIVLERNGFRREGHHRKSLYKHGVYHDSYTYALIR